MPYTATLGVDHVLKPFKHPLFDVKVKIITYNDFLKKYSAFTPSAIKLLAKVTEVQVI